MRPQIVYEDTDPGEPLLAPQRETSFRLVLFYGLVAVVFGIFAMRIIHLQMVRGDELQTMADENRFRTVLTDAARGIIYDRTGTPLVKNIPSYNVTIIPAYVPDEDDEAMVMYKRLSALIGVPVTTTITMEPSPDSKLLFQRPGLHDLSEPSPAYLVPVENKGIREMVELASTFEPYEPTLIKADIERELAQQIEELRPWLPGVEIEVVPVREYPTGELTSHLVGYMGPLPSDDYLDFGYEKTDRVGYAGIEAVLEAELSGTKGEREIEVDVAGKEIRAVGPTIDPVPGVNAYLTIDTRLQAAATRALTRTINAVNQLYDIKLEQGVVIAMDPRSGEILTMVSIPTYDNNRFSTREEDRSVIAQASLSTAPASPT